MLLPAPPRARVVTSTFQVESIPGPHCACRQETLKLILSGPWRNRGPAQPPMLKPPVYADLTAKDLIVASRVLATPGEYFDSRHCVLKVTMQSEFTMKMVVRWRL